MTPCDYFRLSLPRVPSGSTYRQTYEVMKRTEQGLCSACGRENDGEYVTCAECKKEEA